MNKSDFTVELYEKLSSIPFKEIDERLSFYIEIIDDKIDEGISEDEAVASVGSVDDIATEILADIPLSKIVKEKMKNKRKMNAFQIVLLILGFPVWFPILVSLFAVALSVYIVLWSVVVSFWAVFVAVVASVLAGIVSCVYFNCGGFSATGFFMLACAFVLAGLSILMFFASKYATKGLLFLTKKIALSIKQFFVKKEEL